MAADITSPSNERIKWLVRLRERRHRDEEGVFLVEGDRLYRRALEAGLRPTVTFVSPGAGTETLGETVTVAPSALDKASYRRQSQGVIGVFPQRETELSRLIVPESALLLIAEGVEKPGNLGAMLRTVGAAGADALVVVGESIDAHNPNVVRASTGALFSVPLAVSTWDELETWLRERRVAIVSASSTAAESMWEADLAGAVALVVGAEDEGLTARAEEIADRSVCIPQAGAVVDSLNVSVAAAILLFEARRQRVQNLGQCGH